MAEITPEQQEALDDILRVGLIGIGQAMHEAKEGIDALVKRAKKDNTHRTRTCQQKKRYTSLQSATDAMEAWQRSDEKNGRGRAPTRVYRCQFCSGWHLTSQAKRTALVVDGVEVHEYWGHDRDAKPQMIDGRLRMHPFAANELRASDPHELLDLMRKSITDRAAWMMKKALMRLEKR